MGGCYEIRNGGRYKRLRKERNLTQEELAELLNVSNKTVSKWESGSGLPDISQIVPLAAVFGVGTTFCLELTEWTTTGKRTRYMPPVLRNGL
jgi:transcriptional regulator with XRE-family HTH domain